MNAYLRINQTTVGVALALVLASACDMPPYPLHTTDGSPDSSDEPDGCVSGATEWCNEKDDNCDGRIDEGFDLQSDPDNCGRCRERCRLPHAFAACQGGQCVVNRCLPGSADLDGIDDNGCEAFCAISETVASDHCPGPDCCDSADNDCDGEIDEDHNLSVDVNHCGGCGRGCHAPFAQVRCENGQCVVDRCDAGYHNIDDDPKNGCEYRCTPNADEGGQETASTPCNGIDDDCDGEVDEAFVGQGTPCGPDTPPCQPGTIACIAGALQCEGGRQPSPERCNGEDDDCNGDIDDNTEGEGEPCGSNPDACIRGTSVCSQGVMECAGDRDPIGQPCSFDSTPCVEGTWACSGGLLMCQGGQLPRTEVCGDSIDNDCDGLTDDADPDLHIGEPCDDETGLGGVGICAFGVSQCQDGEVLCVGFAPPAQEQCNGLDDDCNGLIDDGLPLVGSCGPHADGFGHYGCLSGEEVCVGFLPASEERCDSKDNDADGTTDNGAICPDEVSCSEGQCVAACSEAPNTLPCASGQVCAEQGCRGSLCRNVTCDDCSTCDPSTGICVDDCAGLECPSGLGCSCGRCWPYSCQVFGCPDGQVCVDGDCAPDPCEQAGCDAGQGCSQGTCFDVCRHDHCDPGQRCVRGECQPDLCATLSCPAGECNPETGRCSSLCYGARCYPGMVCELGTGACVDDPCLQVTCPDTTECVDGSCITPPPTDPDGGPQPDADSDSDAGVPESSLWVVATGGGGAACAASSGRAAAPALVLLALVVCVFALSRRADKKKR